MTFKNKWFQLDRAPSRNHPDSEHDRDVRDNFVPESRFLSGDCSQVMGYPILRASECSQPSQASCCRMSGKANPEHQIWPIPGAPPEFLAPSLARSIISPPDLLGSPIPWLPSPVLIPAHALYLLILGSLPTNHFPGPGKHPYFWAQRALVPQDPRSLAKGHLAPGHLSEVRGMDKH